MKVMDQVITSRQNPTVKWAVTLQERKGRDAAQAFLAEGEKLTLEAARGGLFVSHIFVSQSQSSALLPRLLAAFSDARYDGTVLMILEDFVFEKISTEKTPRGVISVVKYLDFFKELDIMYKEDFLKMTGERVLVLCSVRDPGNLGSVIRSAVAFGVRHVILSDDCADVYNPKTVRSAMGSLFHVRLTCVRDMASVVLSAQAVGRRVLAAELRAHAVPIDEAHLTGEDIILIGNEGHGIDERLSSLATGSVYIPIAEQTESLNAAVAAALFMFAQGRI